MRGQHNYSPMHFAATQVNLEAIRYFLENGTPCTTANSSIACLPLQLCRLINVWPLNVRSTMRAGYAQPNELSADGENVMFLLGFYGGTSPVTFYSKFILIQIN